MHSESSSKTFWRKAKDLLFQHWQDAVAGAIITSAIGACLRFWNAVIDGIRTYPGQVFCTVAFSMAVFAWWKAYLYHRLAQLSQEKALTAESLKRQLAQANTKLEQLTKVDGKDKKWTPTPSLTDRRVITFITCLGKGVLSKLREELSDDEKTVSRQANLGLPISPP